MMAPERLEEIRKADAFASNGIRMTHAERDRRDLLRDRDELAALVREQQDALLGLAIVATSADGPCWCGLERRGEHRQGCARARAVLAKAEAVK